MYPAEFEYRRVDTVPDALDALAGNQDRDVRLLAGGHGLLPDMKAGAAAPDVLVDIGDVGFDAITGDGDGVAVGALATHADLLASDLVADRVPALAEAAAHVGDVQIRNRGTVGGNLVESAPGADLPPAMLATGATIRAESPSGSREIPATDFFHGDGDTALGDDELLVEVRLPATGSGAYVKKTHPATGYAMVGVAAVVDATDDAISNPRVAVAGATDPPLRLPSVEDALDGLTADDDEGLSTAAERAPAEVEDAHLYGDFHASGTFRRELLGTYVERAVRDAIESGGGEDSE